ncbi:MAG TPA: sulfatase-like hydrolase/transferase [Bryobacteraceae bacterium]|nr:sulfatase-like hydrolase/transferase [Bryobacteraceae bacterium]
MKRRDFLKTTTAVTGGVFSGLYKASAEGIPERTPVSGDKPNILFILVDELRYPTVFPDHIKTPGKFLETYMPHVHSLWKRGVKFGEYHNAANACTPSRGVMITGLYSQQNWLFTTITSSPLQAPPQFMPVLNSAYPTYGKLLQSNGYATPYIGKWHVSLASPATNTLQNYGFDYYPTYYDPIGFNLQGTYGQEPTFHSDVYTASQAVTWLTEQVPANKPWCLTVSLINPHDREFFPAGTEFKTVADLFASDTANPDGLKQMQAGYGTDENPPAVSWDTNELKSPKSYGYPTLPPNWESRDDLMNNKPSTQVFIHDFQQGVWGGVTDDPKQTTATIEQYPNPNALENLQLGIAKMPFSYWQRGFDSYTQVMQIVDGQIGRVLEALHSLPDSVVDNTVIVFASDHGEYSGAHGMLQGKMGTVYEEAWHIPLIVVDPSGRFTDDTHIIRNGLTSSVDLLNMLVSIGYRGTNDWMKQGDLAAIYGDRHDMVSMLKSSSAPGRPYVLFATDEIVFEYLNFNKAPFHVVGMRLEDSKLGTYAHWLPLTSQMVGNVQKEFYDYSTKRGQLELDNDPNDPRVLALYENLIHNLIPNELQERLPGSLGVQQAVSKRAELIWAAFIASQQPSSLTGGGLHKLLGYGWGF